MLSVAFDRLEDMTLMIDIGTNGSWLWETAIRW